MDALRQRFAVKYARANSGHYYPAGSMLSLVTWEQQEDRRWFGGKIPGSPKSVEFVTVSMDAEHRRSYLYQKFQGKPLKKILDEEGPTPTERTAYVSHSEPPLCLRCSQAAGRLRSAIGFG